MSEAPSEIIQIKPPKKISRTHPLPPLNLRLNNRKFIPKSSIKFFAAKKILNGFFETNKIPKIFQFQ